MQENVESSKVELVARDNRVKITCGKEQFTIIPEAKGNTQTLYQKIKGTIATQKFSSLAGQCCILRISLVIV